MTDLSGQQARVADTIFSTKFKEAKACSEKAVGQTHQEAGRSHLWNQIAAEKLSRSAVTSNKVYWLSNTALFVVRGG